MNGKAAVVTGASTGIGYAVVEQLSASGWKFEYPIDVDVQFRDVCRCVISLD